MLVTNRAITAAHPQYLRSQHSLRRAVGACGLNYRGVLRRAVSHLAPQI